MKQQLTIDFSFGPEATFDFFYPAGNELLISLVKQLVDGQQQSGSVQFIYIHGLVGSGKTHILQALCHYADTKNQVAQYLPAQELLHLPIDFTLGLENCDLLVIDDVHFLVENYDWQVGLFDLINRCIENHTKMVFTASKPASDIGYTLPDLVSRLNWAQHWIINSLDDQQKQQMLQMRSQARGIPMTDELASYIITRCQQDNASILTCLEQLDAQSLTHQRKLTIPFVKNVMNW